jgi:hypothetical protein
MKTRRWRHGNTETDMETWKHGDIDMETWKHGDCGSKRNKRYDSTGLLTDNGWFIYRFCKE